MPRSVGPSRFGWWLLSGLLCVPALIPIGAMIHALLQPDVGTWGHLFRYVLPEVTVNTLWLLLGVGIGTATIGSALAALVALCEFPGRRFFSWALLLPLAMPTYVLAVAAIGVFDYSSPLASSLRGYKIVLPEIRSRGGIIAVMTLALYPYVYLVARQAFATQGARALEAARSLGMSPLTAFRRAALPMARPWITGGVLLVLMETLADFGAVATFNYDTYTTAIYKAWFALFSLNTALQIAAVMLLLVLLLVALEMRSRRQQHYTSVGVTPAQRLRIRRRWLATACCGGVLALAFVLPVGHLALQAWRHAGDLHWGLIGLVANSVSLGLLAAILVTLAASGLAFAAHAAPGLITTAGARLGTLGYALPGALLAVGLYVPLLHAVSRFNEQFGSALSLQGGILVLMLAYVVRFSAVAHAPVAAGLLRLRPSMLEAVRLLGIGRTRTARQVYWPMLRSMLLTAALLVFVEVMKEMPITLMTRPFGWDTLATRIFELTSEGEYSRAALPALGIVLAGLLPVWILNRGAERAAAA